MMDISSSFFTLLQALQHPWFLNPEMPTPYGTLAQAWIGHWSLEVLGLVTEAILTLACSLGRFLKAL